MSIYALVALVLFTTCQSGQTDSDERDGQLGQTRSQDFDPTPPKNIANRRQKRNFDTDPRRRWHGTQIEYEISPTDYDTADRATIAAAFKHIEARTCLRFVEHPPGRHAPYIYVAHDPESPEACVSEVGRNFTVNQQLVGIGPGCVRMGVIVHEIMHRLGFFHEQSRPDRDNFVWVIGKHIEENKTVNFGIHGTIAGLPRKLGYDYESVMHYKTRAFSKNRHKATIVPKPPGKKYLIGQRLGMSDLDAKKLNALFKCKKQGSLYQKNLKKAIKLLKPMTLPNLAKLTSCPGNLVSEAQCQTWLGQGYCGERQIAAACPRVCGLTVSCLRWKQYGYCTNKKKKKIMRRFCHCACFD